MNVLRVIRVAFTTREHQLKTQTTVGHRGNSNSKGMHILTVVLLVHMRKLFANPALKVRDIAV
jgi:hypothetical protein